MIHLIDRAIIAISGPDRKKFLQGLLTNDVEKASTTNLIYTTMLNAQGRFLYDFFIFEINENLMLDCLATRRDEIIQKLSFYKLRAQVAIKKEETIKVISSTDDKGFSDPRNAKLGYRFYSADDVDASLLDSYHYQRISLKIPESEHDLTYEKSFILEFGFDDLNAIDYNKGCYVGQELTARTHHRGEIRKKIFHVKISTKCAEKNSEIYCEGKSVGLILSSVFHENELHALALIKDPQDLDLTKLEFANQKISVVS